MRLPGLVWSGRVGRVGSGEVGRVRSGWSGWSGRVEVIRSIPQEFLAGLTVSFPRGLAGAIQQISKHYLIA